MSIDREKCDVKVVEIQPFVNDEYTGFDILWAGSIGFGCYEIYQKANDQTKWYAASECMDANDDKWFIRKLMDQIIDKLEITE